MSRLISFLSLVFICLTYSYSADTTYYYQENFEVTDSTGSLPSAWQQSGTKSWRRQRGGDSPSTPVAARRPNMDHTKMDLDSGLNITFAYQSTDDSAIVFTAPFNLEFSNKPQLQFYHTQAAKKPYGTDFYWSKLKVYYKTSDTGTVHFLQQYTDSTPRFDWIERSIIMPEIKGKTIYIGFKAFSSLGSGVSIDDISVYEAGSVKRRVNSIAITQSNNGQIIPSGTINNPLLQILIKVSGNTDSLPINLIRIKSEFTNNADIETNGVKLYYTAENKFENPIAIGTAQSISGGYASFSNPNYNLKTGDNYLWVTVNLKSTAVHNNIADFQIETGDITIRDSVFSDFNGNPTGSRTIYEAIYKDDFETITGDWTLTGEFEIADPSGLGGKEIGPDPTSATSGLKVLGTDVTGNATINGNANANPGNYEDSIGLKAYTATSKMLDFSNYNNVDFFFYRYLNIYSSDKAYIEVSNNNGNTWTTVWTNTAQVSDNQWKFINDIDVTSLVSRKDSVRIRFSMGPTFATESGWNIDDIIFTGNYVEKDVLISDWTAPVTGCVKSNSNATQVKVKIKNNAADVLNSPVIVEYSFLGAMTKTVRDTFSGTINPGQETLFTFSETVDLSTPYYYYDFLVHVKTILVGDEDTTNDKLSKNIYMIPTYNLPYQQDFEIDEDFWMAVNKNNANMWTYGSPSDFYDIKTAASGYSAWVTNFGGNYQSNDSSFLMSPCFTTTGKDLPIVEFKHWDVVVDSNDGFTMQYSLNDGISWSNINSHPYSFKWSWHDSNFVNAIGAYGWNDTNSNGYDSLKQILPSATANKASVRFRFLFMSDSITNSYGVSIDDFKLYDAPIDAGVSKILSPLSSCELSAAERVKVAIKNYGIESIKAGDSLTLQVTVIDSLSRQTKTEKLVAKKTIAIGDTMQYFTKNTFNMYQAGTYHIIAKTASSIPDNIYSDSPYNNDSIIDSVIVSKPYVELGRNIWTVHPDTISYDVTSSSRVKYLWSNNSTSPLFDVAIGGTYYVRLTDTVTSCIARDTVIITQLIADIGIDSVLNPNSACELTTSESFTVRIRNFGTDTIRSNYQIKAVLYIDNDSLVENFTIPATVLPNGNYIYTFSNKYNMSAIKSYNIKAFTKYIDDHIATNDTSDPVIKTVYGYPNVNLQPEDTIHKGLSFRLNAKKGNPLFKDFLWTNGSTDSTLLINTQGTGVYAVTVTSIYNCSASDSSIVRLVYPDISVTNISEPKVSCGPMKNSPMRFDLKNTGTDTIEIGEIIDFSSQINSEAFKLMKYTLTTRLYPNDSLLITHDTLINYDSIGTHSLKIFSDFDRDSVNSNNLAFRGITIHPLANVDLNGPAVFAPVNDTAYIVDAGPTFDSYLWNDGSTGQTFKVTTAKTKPTTAMWCKVLVTDNNSCTDTDSIYVILNYSDVTVLKITTQDTLCALDKNNVVRVAILNKGAKVLNNVNILLKYRVNNDVYVTETVSSGSNVKVYDTIYKNLSKSLNISTTGDNTFEILTAMSGDVNAKNDTLRKEYYLYGYPTITWPMAQDTIKVNSPYTLSPLESFNSYQWQDNSTGSSIAVSTDGYYKLIATDSNGCSSKDSVYYINTIGIDNILSNRNIEIYPIPAKDKLTIALKEINLNKLILNMTNSKGVMVYHSILSPMEQSIYTIPLTNYASGIYFLQLTDGDVNFGQVVIIE